MNMHYEKKSAIFDFNNGKMLVESCGYISSQKQIEALIYSGKKLAESRMHEFDFKPGDELIEDDSMELRNIDDLAEGMEIVNKFKGIHVSTIPKAQEKHVESGVTDSNDLDKEIEK